MDSKDVIPVGEYLDRLNLSLRSEKARILGEVSGVQMYEGRSYLYFSLKDGKEEGTVKCFMWKRDFNICGVEISDGMEVVITAYPNIYKPNGGLTMQVESLELVGEGALEKAYKELRKKLELEGLFLDSRKREIPEFPKRIGVITSKSGAVINDFLSNIGKFGFEILFVDSRVEGQDAVRDLLASVETLRKQDIDVLVLMRGGGSLESFLAFNNEALVRAVSDFPVPVLTGIGHDKDAPLLSLVSDKNVSTPTAVANLLNATWKEAEGEVRLLEESIFSQFESIIKDARYELQTSESVIEDKFEEVLRIFKTAEDTLVSAVSYIENAIRRGRENIALYAKQLEREFARMIAETHAFVLQSAKGIEHGNPERQLKRGYSIVRNKGKVIRKVKDVDSKDILDITVADGIIHTQVT